MGTQRTGKESGGAPETAPTPAKPAPPPAAERGEPPSGGISTGTDQERRSLEDAYARFVAALVEAKLEADAESAQALRSYVDAVRSAVEEVTRVGKQLTSEAVGKQANSAAHAREAHHDYVAAVQPSGEDIQAAVEAQRALSEAVQTAQAEAGQQAEEAMRQHTSAQLEGQERAAAALRDYAAAIQKAPQDATGTAEAYRRYTSALEEIAADTGRRCEEAGRAYAASQVEAQRRTTEALKKYMDALRGPAPGDNRRADATRTLTDTLRTTAADALRQGDEGTRRYLEAQREMQRRADEAQRTYGAALEQVRTNAPRRQAEAYRTYLLAVQRAWTLLNVDALVAGMRG
jgi:hypothetical protein